MQTECLADLDLADFCFSSAPSTFGTHLSMTWVTSSEGYYITRNSRFQDAAAHRLEEIFLVPSAALYYTTSRFQKSYLHVTELSQRILALVIGGKRTTPLNTCLLRQRVLFGVQRSNVISAGHQQLRVTFEHLSAAHMYCLCTCMVFSFRFILVDWYLSTIQQRLKIRRVTAGKEKKCRAVIETV